MYGDEMGDRVVTETAAAGADGAREGLGQVVVQLGSDERK